MARRLLPLLLALALLPALPAAAQEPPSPPPAAAVLNEGFSDLIEQLDVVARPPGPAIWRVKKGESELLILGGLSPLPHALQWDTARIERYLDGANRMLTPPRARVSVLSAPAALVMMSKLRSDTRPEAAMPPDLSERFTRIRSEAVKTPASRYARWKPAVAAALLLQDYREAAGLSSGKPGTTVARLAQQKKVPIRALSHLDYAQVMKPLSGLSPGDNALCVKEILDEIERESAQAQPQAAAWAIGDIPALKRSKPSLPLEGCLTVVGGYRTVLEKATADATAQMQRALAEPGRTVAVLDLILLLRANGVLDRLQAGGAEVTTPP